MNYDDESRRRMTEAFFQPLAGSRRKDAMTPGPAEPMTDAQIAEVRGWARDHRTRLVPIEYVERLLATLDRIAPDGLDGLADEWERIAHRNAEAGTETAGVAAEALLACARDLRAALAASPGEPATVPPTAEPDRFRKIVKRLVGIANGHTPKDAGDHRIYALQLGERFIDEARAALKEKSVPVDAPGVVLDRAWKEAEEALPDGWHGPIVTTKPGWAESERWAARAYSGHGANGKEGRGSTPANALVRLAARLREPSL